MLSFRPLISVFVAACALTSIAFAQDEPLLPGMDTLTFFTKVGSFKLLGGSPKSPPHGHLEMSFTGTLLVVGLKGNIQVSGNIQKEYSDAKYLRTVYFGIGKVVIDGEFLSAQWFGRDMSATFKGQSILRLYGEFDRDLQTGKFFYGNEPNNKVDWGPGRQLEIPMAPYMRKIVPKVRGGG